MHDDTHIRSLRNGGNLHIVGGEGEAAKGDSERRVQRSEAMLELVPDSQVDDLEPTVRELPISAETVALRNQAALLKQEHKDLDDAIRALEIVPQPDQILIARMKRKKLFLRDTITSLEDKIRPDIIA